MDRRTLLERAVPVGIAGLAPTIVRAQAAGVGFAFPLSGFYLCKVAQRSGREYATETVRKVLSQDVDTYAAECRMPA